MPKLRLLTAAALAALCLSTPQTASAWTLEGGTATVKPGVATAIKAFSNCRDASLVGVSGFTEHGKISSRESKGYYCSQRNFPATLVIYTSEPGFVGDDHIIVYIDLVGYSTTVTVQK